MGNKKKADGIKKGLVVSLIGAIVLMSILFASLLEATVVENPGTPPTWIGTPDTQAYAWNFTVRDEGDGGTRLLYINLTFTSISGFGASWLDSLTNDASSGVALYEDTGTPGWDGSDTLLTYNPPSWVGLTVNFTGMTKEIANSASINILVILNLSNTAIDNGKFNISIPANNIGYNNTPDADGTVKTMPSADMWSHAAGGYITTDVTTPSVSDPVTVYPAGQSNYAKNGDTVKLNVTASDTPSGLSSPGFVKVNVNDLNTSLNWVDMTNVAGNYWEANVELSGATTGTKTLTVNATDKAGNANTTVTLSVRVDADIPEDLTGATVNNYTATSNWTNNANFFVNWTGNGDNAGAGNSGLAGYYYKLDSAPTTYNDGTFTSIQNCTVDLSAYADGNHTMYIWAIDYAHNKGNNAVVYLRYDTTPPTLNSIVISDTSTGNTTWTNSLSVTLTVSASDASDINIGAKMCFKNEGGTWSDWEPYGATKAWNLPSAAADGVKTVYFKAKDVAGNENTTGISDTIILDMTKPGITNTGTVYVDRPGLGFATMNDTVTLYAKITDPTAGLWYNATGGYWYVTLNVTPLNSSLGWVEVKNKTGDSTNFTYTMEINWTTINTDGDGDKYIQINATDNATNQNLTTGTNGILCKIDTTSPLVTANPTVYPTFTDAFGYSVQQTYAKNGDDVILNATITDNGTLKYVGVNVTNITGVPNNWVTLTRVGSTNYYTATVTVAGALNGTHNLLINATDNLNNTNLTEYINVSVDNVIPVVSNPWVNYNITAGPHPFYRAYAGNGETVRLNITVTDANSSVSYVQVNVASLNTSMTWVNMTDSGGGNYTVDVEISGASNGTKSLQVKAFDQAGKLNSTEYIYVTVNNPPEVTNPAVDYTNYTWQNCAQNGTIINITVTVTDDDVSAVNITLYDTSTNENLTYFGATGKDMIQVGTTNTWYYQINVSATADGYFNLTINATDSAGNWNNTENVTVKVDNQIPSVSQPNVVYITDYGNNGWANNGTVITINVTVTDDFAGIYNVTVNASAIGGLVWQPLTDTTWSGANNYTVNLTVSANTGNYTLWFKVYDNASNLNDTINVTVYVDNILPTVTYAGYACGSNGTYVTNLTTGEPAFSVNNSEDLVLNVTVSDAASGILWNGTNWYVMVNVTEINATGWIMMVNASGSTTNFTCTVGIDETIRDGNWTLYINATDNATNKNTTTIKVWVKGVAPKLIEPYAWYPEETPSNTSAATPGHIMTINVTVDNSSGCHVNWTSGVMIDVGLITTGPGTVNWTAMYDDGTHGDVTAGDGNFTVNITVGADILSGTYNLTINATDIADRSSYDRDGSINWVNVKVDIDDPIVTPKSTIYANGSAANMSDWIILRVLVTDSPAGVYNVTVDVSAINSTYTTPWTLLYDDGTHGDATSGDGIYARNITVDKGADGTHYIPVKAIDNVNHSTSDYLIVLIDTGGPAVVVTVTTQGSGTNNTAIIGDWVNITVTTDTDVVSVTVNLSEFCNETGYALSGTAALAYISNGVWYLNFTLYPSTDIDVDNRTDSNPYNFDDVIATDNAGNTGTNNTTAKLDAYLPTSSVTAFPSRYWNVTQYNAAAGGITVQWSGGAADDIYFDVYKKVGVTGTWSLWLTGTTELINNLTAISEGETYYFYSVAKDWAGNVEQAYYVSGTLVPVYNVWTTEYDFAAPITDVGSLAVYNGKLYAGTYDGGKIYVYDGLAWTLSYTPPAGIDDIRSLAVYDGKLYAGAGNDAGDGDIYVYDGTSWTTSYDTTEDMILSLAVYDGKLYAGSYCAGAAKVLVYDGAAWATSYTLPAGYEAVPSLAVYDDKLYAGAGEDAGDGDIFVYDGISWTMVYDTDEDVMGPLAVYDGKLYAGSYSATPKVFVYDGTGWATSYTLPAGYDCVRSLAVYDDKLYAGAGVDPGDGDIFVFDGTSWTTSYDTAQHNIWALAVYNDELYAGSGSNGIIYRYGYEYGDANVTVDTAMPDFQVYLIDNGTLYDNDHVVVLNVSVTDETSKMGQVSFSEDGGATWSAWETYSFNIDLTYNYNYKPYTFTNTTDGTRTIYFRARDQAGNIKNGSIAPEIKDTIILDELKPINLNIVINGGANYTTSRNIVLTLNATEDMTEAWDGVVSGVYQIWISENNVDWVLLGDWLGNGTYDYTLSPGDGDRPVYFKVNDRADNNATAVDDSIQLDTGEPTTTATVTPAAADGQNGWYLSNVTVNLSATDPQGVAKLEYRIVWNNGTDTGWITVTNFSAFNIINVTYLNFTIEGVHTLYYNATDNQSVVETMHTLVIKIDRTNSTMELTTDVTANENNWYNTTVTVTLTANDISSEDPLNATTSGANWTKYRIWDLNTGYFGYFNETGVWTNLSATNGWANYSGLLESTGPFTIPLEGNYSIQFNTTDYAGNWNNTNATIRYAASNETYLRIDMTSPSALSVDVDGHYEPGGATLADTYTNNTWVDLDLGAFDPDALNRSGLWRMQLSNNGTDWGYYNATGVWQSGGFVDWTANLTNYNWYLPAETVAGNYNKTVYFRIYDNASNYAELNGSIILDTKGPTSWVTVIPSQDYQTEDFNVSWDGTDYYNDMYGSNISSFFIQYRYDDGTTGWTAWMWNYTVSSPGTYAFTAVDGRNFEFRCRATDRLGWTGENSTVVSTLVDLTKPTSSVDAITTYWHNTGITITATSSDSSPGIASGVASLELFYRYSDDNITFGAWTSFGTSTTGSWEFTFSPDGDGYYQFYSIATDNAGNTEVKTPTTEAIVGYDAEVPTTTPALSGTEGENSWYTSDVSVTLTATDPSPSSGGLIIEYYVDTGSWTTYTVAFTITTDDIHTVYYRTTDAAGNVESTGTKEVKVDQTLPPKASTPSDTGVYSTLTSMTWTWTASTDATSGIAGYYICIGTTSNANETVVNHDVGNVLTYSWAGSEGITYYAKIKAYDAAGNVGTYSEASDGITIDTVAPIANAPVDEGKWSTDTTLVWTWTPSTDATSGVAGYYICIGTTVGGNEILDDYWVGNLNSFTATAADGITDGSTYYAKIKAVDNAGNIGGYSGYSDGITVDATPPTSSMTALPTYTTSTSFTVSWSSSDLDVASYKLEYKYTGIDNWASLYTGTGLSYEFTNAVEGKTYYFRVIATDEAGNPEVKTASDTSTTIDTKAPTTTDNAPSGWQTATVTITLTEADATSGVANTYYKVWPAAETEPADYSPYTEPVTISTDGKWKFKYYSVDVAGNEQNPVTRDVWRDTVAPTTTAEVTSGTLGENDWYTSGVTVTLSSTDATSAVSVVNYIINSGTPQSGTTIQLTTDGTYIIEFYATDNAGKVETIGTANTITVKIDKTAPTTTYDAPSGWQTTSPVVVTLTATDGTGSGVSYTYYKQWLSTSTEPTSYTAGTSFNITDEGKWYVKYYSVDTAGKAETPTTKEVWIDTVVPTTTDNAPDGWQTTTVTVTLTASDGTGSGVAYTYYKKWLITGTEPEDDTAGTTVTINTDGKWYIKYYSVDTATNAETAHTIEVWFDATAPTALSISINADADYTTSATVTLTLSATGATQTLVSNDQITWTAYNASWALSAGDGTKTVYFKAVDDAGNYAIASDTIILDKTSPTVILTSDKATIYEGETVQFNGASSSDTNGIATYGWDIDGDGVTDYTTASPSHKYTKKGTYTVTLTVTDNAGLSSSASVTITVNPKPEPSIPGFEVLALIAAIGVAVVLLRKKH